MRDGAEGEADRRATGEPCGFALLANRILVTETWGSRKRAADPRPFSPQTLADALSMPVSRVRDRLNGSSAIRPLEARLMIAHTGDVRLAHWLLEGTAYVPALRPDAIKPAKGTLARLPRSDDARIYTSAVDLAHEAASLLDEAIKASADLMLDARDRAKLKEELKGVETALATLNGVLAGVERGMGE